jgi:hypothetical protein
MRMLRSRPVAALARHGRAHARLVGLAFGLAAASCASHEDNVCEDIGDCAQGGDSTFIANCKAEAKALRVELTSYGCDPLLDEYYACADSTFQCQGATPTFSCNAGLQLLDGCIHVNERATACAALATQQANCTTPPAPPAAGPPACSLARDCEARCLLANAADVCAPRPDELDAIRACTSACPSE